jgi:hypothetical protein
MDTSPFGVLIVPVLSAIMGELFNNAKNKPILNYSNYCKNYINNYRIINFSSTTFSLILLHSMVMMYLFFEDGIVFHINFASLIIYQER